MVINRDRKRERGSDIDCLSDCDVTVTPVNQGHVTKENVAINTAESASDIEVTAVEVPLVKQVKQEQCAMCTDVLPGPEWEMPLLLLLVTDRSHLVTDSSHLVMDSSHLVTDSSHLVVDSSHLQLTNSSHPRHGYVSLFCYQHQLI